METQYSNTFPEKLVGRNTSFELLRIISMFFITICHFATHGDFSFDTQCISIPRIWWYFIEMGGTFGVDVFVLISGYFLILDEADIPNFKRLLKIWGQLVFYAIGIYAILCFLGFYEFSLLHLIKLFFPITTDHWWFASTYFILYMIHPYINMFLNCISKRVFQNFILLTLFIWCFLPTITSVKYQSNNLIWFIILYSVAAYIRLYGLNSHYNAHNYFWGWILFSLLRFGSSIIIITIGTRISSIANYSLAFYGRQSMLTFMSALCFFMFFKNIRISQSKIINTIASASFGVYLIQEHNSLRPILWLTIIQNNKFQESSFLIIYSIISALSVYVICSIIDLIRHATVERIYMTFINNHYIKLKRILGTS